MPFLLLGLLPGCGLEGGRKEAAFLSANLKQSISTSTIPKTSTLQNRPIIISDPQICHRQMITRVPGREYRGPGEQEKRPLGARTQCYKNGLVVGGLEANGLDEDPVWKETTTTTNCYIRGKKLEATEEI